jgi:hypothetical protein
MRRRGSLLLEQVVTIGLVGMLLMMVAAMTIQTGRGSKSSRLDFEAKNIGKSVLESYQARAVDLLSVGTEPPLTGQFSNGIEYTATAVLADKGGTGIYAGLTPNEIKGILVTVTWVDANGSHNEQVEGVLVRIAR